MKLIGCIARLQLQRASLKVGQRPRRAYDPTSLLPVPALRISPEGVTGHADDNAPLIDVHHRHHPESKNRGDNGISLGFTMHYERMRSRFGRHVTDGIAGENILVQSDEVVRELDLLEGIVIVTAAGRHVHLSAVEVAEPCAEFSRYALRYSCDMPADRQVTEALRFLRGGMRGFYASYAGEPVLVRPGDRVFRV